MAIYFVIFIALGYFYYSFFFIQIMLSVSATKRLIYKLKKYNVDFDMNKLRTRSNIAIIFWGIISIIVFYLLNTYIIFDYAFGFYIGFVFGLLVSLKKLGLSKDNMQDIFSTYKNCFRFTNDNFYLIEEMAFKHEGYVIKCQKFKLALSMMLFYSLLNASFSFGGLDVFIILSVLYFIYRNITKKILYHPEYSELAFSIFIILNVLFFIVKAYVIGGF